ncbi:type VI secretion system protein TssL, long form [Vibrio atypicus]|uniref:type VI secretion system protein TssL, long form n=1 Tax=Vibrio atypicus TaxID=558271 RepID=UPI00373688B9
MSEATIMKPRPGNRAGKKQPKEQYNSVNHSQKSDCTVVASSSVNRFQNLSFPQLGDNSLVEEANSLLSMIGQIRCTSTHGDIASLHQACIEKVRAYEASLRHHQVTPEQIESARYCLCCFVDETVLNTNWGEHSIWSTNSLLSTFHSQTWGGEHFFTLLDQNLASPRANSHLLELQYVCLCLGFVGKMRVEDKGIDRLENYRQQAFESLQLIEGELDPLLTPQSHETIHIGSEVHRGLPIWVIVAVCGVFLLSVYMVCSYSLNSYSDKVFNNLNNLAKWKPRSESSSVVDDKQLAVLKQRLHTEIERKLIDVQPLNDRIRISIRSQELFEPGRAEVMSSIVPVLQKLSRILESTDGRILITGHTDDQPIFTSRYPSNWHLSLARATSVANNMAIGTSLQGRLWPEGRGDSEPLVSNQTEEQRAFNRRVEIDLLY